MITTSATDYCGDTSATRRLECEQRDLKDRIQHLNIELFEMERSMNIHNRWEPGDREYQDTLQYIATRRYQQALGRLQRLVIQRLFELQKMNLSHTGTPLPWDTSHCMLTIQLSLSRSHAHSQEPPEKMQGHPRGCEDI